MTDQREFLKHRRQKLQDLRAAGINPFANNFKPQHTTHDIRNRMGSKTKEELDASQEVFSVAGRIMSLRDFGKSVFLHLRDRTGTIQVYVQKNTVGQERYSIFKKFDLGDFIGVCGRVFLTHSGELTILATDVTLLTKSLRPLPEKWHGLQDIETRYRQRYLDLIVNEPVRATFQTRSQIIALIREFLVARDFLEVETPMMQTIAGGATAQPFVTHHNALDMDLYLRIAPELYLKRLLVGGFERVFEINRNFRNEGISTQHNPEFTMLEFYCAYATYEDLMQLTQDLFCFLCSELFGTLTITYQGTELDFTPPWKRMTLKEAAAVFAGVPPNTLDDPARTRELAGQHGVVLPESAAHGEVITALFEAAAEPHLVQPTFITHYPVEISPLARTCENDPSVTDRFELYIAGREIANAFSELNDPDDQRRRFVAQAEAKARLTGEPAVIDEDFLLALEHGMPPAAGEGIGIDRLVMLLTDAASIRDVILFPLFRAERTEPA